MFQRIIEVFFVFLLVPFQSLTFAGVGTSGFDLLRRDLSAFSVSLATATVAHPKKIFDGGNPAHLSMNALKSVSAGYVHYPLGMNAGQILYKFPIENFSAAAKIVYFDYGTFDKRSITGQKLGTFGANDWMFSGALGSHWKNLSYGFEVGYLNSTIENYSASAVVLHLGMVYRLPEEYQAKLACEIRNLGVNVKKYATSVTKLPTSVKIGGSKKLQHLPLTLLAQITKWNDTGMFYSMGGDVEVSENLSFRGGYNSQGKDQNVGGTKESTAGFSLGVGIKIKEYSFDFAYELQGIVGDKIYLQINWLPQ